MDGCISLTRKHRFSISLVPPGSVKRGQCACLAGKRAFPANLRRPHVSLFLLLSPYLWEKGAVQRSFSLFLERCRGALGWKKSGSVLQRRKHVFLRARTPAVGEVGPSVAEGLCSLELAGVGEGTGNNSRCMPRMAWDLLPILLLTFFWLVSLLGN